MPHMSLYWRERNKEYVMLCYFMAESTLTLRTSHFLTLIPTTGIPDIEDIYDEADYKVSKGAKIRNRYN